MPRAGSERRGSEFHARLAGGLRHQAQREPRDRQERHPANGLPDAPTSAITSHGILQKRDAVGELDMGVVWVKSVASATPQTRRPACAGR